MTQGAAVLADKWLTIEVQSHSQWHSKWLPNYDYGECQDDMSPKCWRLFQLRKSRLPIVLMPPCGLISLHVFFLYLVIVAIVWASNLSGTMAMDSHNSLSILTNHISHSPCQTRTTLPIYRGFTFLGPAGLIGPILRYEKYSSVWLHAGALLLGGKER